jgi:2'-5' RNA ligase
MRLFVAVLLPTGVTALVRGLQRRHEKALRWTTEAQWHVTLRFLGAVAEPDAVSDALGAVPALLDVWGVPPVTATLGPAVAWFPGRRVLQVPVDGLESLAAAVQQATAPWGGPAEDGSEDRPYRGHLTLARASGAARGPASLAGALLGADWPVEAIYLMASTLGPGGARYSPLTTIPLFSPT